MQHCTSFLSSYDFSLLQAIMPILMRCRAFLPVGVGLKVVIEDPRALAFVDKGRLGQIITNGLRCVV